MTYGCFIELDNAMFTRCVAMATNTSESAHLLHAGSTNLGAKANVQPTHKHSTQRCLVITTLKRIHPQMM